jgi:hypothetical protein
VVALVGLSAGVTAVAAQERALGPPVATHSESFAVVNTVRELNDGRVLVADPLSKVLIVLDADLLRADTLGRLGEGPAEYLQPAAVWPLPGDSTLLVDLGNTRLTMLDSDGVFGRTRPIAQGNGGPRTPPALVLPSGVDAQGAIYFTSMPGMGPDGPSDTVTVLRLAADGGAPTPIAQLKTTSFTSRTSGGANNQNVNISPIPLSATDVWAVAPDGSVAVARAGEVRVDWISPDGTTTRGSGIDLSSVPIRQAEKEEWSADRESSGGGIGIEMTIENGARSMRMSRGGMGEGPDLNAMTWPDQKAPWVAASGRIDAEGRFWARRSLPAGAPALYDVFARDGSLVGSVRFPEGRRLVGFGQNAIYAVDVDPFDLKTLERYALPPL